MARPRTYRISLSKKERNFVKSVRRKTKSSTIHARCSVLLEADENRWTKVRSNSEIAAKAGVSKTTVITVLKLFSKGGVSEVIKLGRNQNSDVSRLKVTGDIEAHIVAKACSSAPKGFVRWTLTLLAEEMKVILEEPVSRSTIGRVLQNNDIRPHLSEYWSIPPEEDADFVANMEDILELYQMPYDPDYPLWCMDEKPFQLLNEARDPLPMRPGDTAKYDSDYIRNGTAAVFCFIQPHTGRIEQKVEPTRTAVDWAEKIRYLVDEIEPNAKKIILVMDNLNIHNTSSLYKAFPPEEARRIAKKIEIHFTPKHGSWLDIAEIGINIMTRECLNRRIGSIEKLQEELDAWNIRYNGDPTPITWQFQTEDSRIKLRRLYPDIDKFRKARDDRQAAKAT